MRLYLNDFFETLTTREQRRASTILEESRVDKETASTLATTLAEFGDTVPLFLVKEEEQSLIRAGGIANNLRDYHLYIREMFRAANLASDLLESEKNILISEVRKLEDELNILEKQANNYAFLLADHAAYNAAYLEPFSDERGRADFETSPDRGTLDFGPAEKASIKADEGVLVLPQNLTTSYSLAADVVDGNISGNLDNLDLSGTIVAGRTDGWRATADVNTPVTSGLPIADGLTGAQVVLEYRLSNAAPCSEIRIDPYSDTGMDLVQIITYPDLDESGSQKLLTQPKVLDRPITINFPMRSVLRFKIVLNQPTYNRISSFASFEDDYRKAYEDYQDAVKLIKDRYNINRAVNFRGIRYLLLKSFMRRFLNGRWQPSLDIHTPSEFTTNLSLWNDHHYHRGDPRFINGNRMPLELFKRYDAIYRRLLKRQVDKFEDFLDANGLLGPEGFLVDQMEARFNSDFFYRYTLGLHSVSIGVSSIGYKGFFTSKAVPADGDFGEVRIKSEQQNIRDTRDILDNTLLTSVEYSVSNKSKPVAETDWIPILPIDVTIVESERLFPDDTGKCFFRFTATTESEIEVYKNGYKLIYDLASDLIVSASKQGATGLRLPLNSYGSDDILTVRYTPVHDYSVVNFENEGFDEVPLVTSFSANGAGDYFASTSGRSSVDLTHVPYIDQDSVNEATYVEGFGLSFAPVVVKTEDGTTFINLTDYTGLNAVTLPDSGNYYIHSGTTLMFSEPVNEPFRVYYEFLQNNVRFRCVLRCNSRDFVSPKVDSVHLKAKTRRPQPDANLGAI